MTELPTHPLSFYERFVGLDGQVETEVGTREFGRQGIQVMTQCTEGLRAVRRRLRTGVTRASRRC
jgi:hypothetical protein